MPKREKRSVLEQQFVNLYRQAWGSNIGLSKQKLARFTDRQLIIDIGSLKRFIKRSQK